MGDADLRVVRLIEMFKHLFGRREAAPQNALSSIRNVTLGRTVRVDPLAWKQFGAESRFPLDHDTLVITAQGLVQLDEGGFVHRFYTDDHLMLQAVSDDREGQAVSDVTLWSPWDSQYPGGAADRRAWIERLRRRSFQPEGLPEYRRFWFGDQAESQEPVSFWEEVHDDRDGVPDRRIYQTTMLFARDLNGGVEAGGGRELLLALEMEPQNEAVSHEIMIGVPLELGEFTA